MIQITAYLRDENDLIKWRQVSNKAEFLHQALQSIGSPVPLRAYEKITKSTIQETSRPSDGESRSETIKPQTQKADKICPIHGVPLAQGKCLQNGCKYSSK